MGACMPKQKSDKLLSDYDKDILHCGLCRCEIKHKMYILQCGHQFHTVCIYDHFNDIGSKNHGYAVCPVCSKTHPEPIGNLKKKQLHKNLLSS
jgi:hypothetical protein